MVTSILFTSLRVRTWNRREEHARTKWNTEELMHRPMKISHTKGGQVTIYRSDLSWQNPTHCQIDQSQFVLQHSLGHINMPWRRTNNIIMSNYSSYYFWSSLDFLVKTFTMHLREIAKNRYFKPAGKFIHGIKFENVIKSIWNMFMPCSRFLIYESTMPCRLYLTSKSLIMTYWFKHFSTDSYKSLPRHLSLSPTVQS